MCSGLASGVDTLNIKNKDYVKPNGFGITGKVTKYQRKPIGHIHLKQKIN